MKKLVAILLCLAMVLSMAACAQTGPKTQEPPKQETTDNSGETKVSHPAIKVSLGYSSADETLANIVRDQLTKKGFEVELKAFPDGASLKNCQVNGDADMCFFSWGNVVGTPDYGIAAVWSSDGDSNRFGYSNPTVDKMIVEAAGLPLESNHAKYEEIEDIVARDDVEYIALYRNMSNNPYSPVMDPAAFHPNAHFGEYSFKDASQNETRTFTRAQTSFSFNTFDCVRINDGSTGSAMDNSYIMLTSLDNNYKPTTDWSLSRNFCTAEDCSNFYFILRDDCHFAKVENMHAVVMDKKVSAEDVVFSITRSFTKTSVPLHQTYSLYNKIDGVSIVTDLSELENVKATTGKSVRAELENGITPIASLTDNRNEVKNSDGIYQVVKIHTMVPFPQILNNLAHHGAGIVDSEWVAECNKDFNYDTYDANKDKIYGDSVNCMEGPTYNNDLHCSGPYVLISYNDYQMNFERNDGFYTDEPGKSHIKTIVSKFISDKDANLSALRSGEIDYVGGIPESKWDVAESDPNCVSNIQTGTRVYCMAFNCHGNSEVANSLDLRKAIASCINYKEIEAVLKGHSLPARSFLTVCWPDSKTSNYYEGADTQAFIDAYWAAKEGK